MPSDLIWHSVGKDTERDRPSDELWSNASLGKNGIGTAYPVGNFRFRRVNEEGGVTKGFLLVASRETRVYA